MAHGENELLERYLQELDRDKVASLQTIEVAQKRLREIEEVKRRLLNGVRVSDSKPTWPEFILNALLDNNRTCSQMLEIAINSEVGADRDKTLQALRSAISRLSKDGIIKESGKDSREIIWTRVKR